MALKCHLQCIVMRIKSRWTVARDGGWFGVGILLRAAVTRLAIVSTVPAIRQPWESFPIGLFNRTENPERPSRVWPLGNYSYVAGDHLTRRF
jgi:hypothetical protein